MAEYKAAIAAQNPRRRERLAELGMIKPAHRIGLVGFARIKRDGIFFEPDADGAPALIFPVVEGPTMSVPTTVADHPDRLVDLVAWHPARPVELACRLGNAVALGEEAIRDALLTRTALRLFRDPGRWAAADGEGAVIVLWEAADELLRLPALIADDVEHGAEVQRQLKLLRSRMLRRLPRVRVPA